MYMNTADDCVDMNFIWTRQEAKKDPKNFYQKKKVTKYETVTSDETKNWEHISLAHYVKFNELDKKENETEEVFILNRFKTFAKRFNK